MLKVVSNTTPLISLLKLSKITLLREIYTKITIPYAVYQEIEAGINKDYYHDFANLSWIEIQKIKDPNALKYFLELDAGEAEAIVLATELKADILLMDEKLGRLFARNTGIKTTGTLGVLVKAKELGIIKKLKPLLIELTAKNVWISDKLQYEILTRVGE